MFLLVFIRTCYLIITVIAVLSFIIPTLRASILATGKLVKTATPARDPFAHWLKKWTVPKAWFAHFYYVGAVLGIWCFLEVTLLVWYARRGPLIYLLREWDV